MNKCPDGHPYKVVIIGTTGEVARCKDEDHWAIFLRDPRLVISAKTYATRPTMNPDGHPAD